MLYIPACHHRCVATPNRGERAVIFLNVLVVGRLTRVYLTPTASPHPLPDLPFVMLFPSNVLVSDYAAGSMNVQGEVQKELDVLSNRIFLTGLCQPHDMSCVASEEEEYPRMCSKVVGEETHG